MARTKGAKDKKKRKSKISQSAIRINLNADSAYYRSARVRIVSR